MSYHVAQHPGNWWPLAEGRVTAEQQLAGATLRGWQTKHQPQQGQQYENAWVSAEDWQRLQQSEAGSVLVDGEGRELAWLGDKLENYTRQVVASEHSYLLLYPWQLLDVNEALISELHENVIQGEVSPAAHVEGVIEVGEGTRILPGVYIEGNVIIGENCKIGPNCYIRGNTTIGNGVHIGQSVEIKNSVIGHGSSVGHLSYVGDSILGHKVNFGAGTTTSNLRHDGSNHHSAVDGELIGTGRRKLGTIVGDNVHTGIHTAIYPGRKLGSGSSTLPNATVQKDIS